MAAFKTFIIGSAASCDITIERSTVAARHAELVIARNGRLHLTDRLSETGTFRKSGDDWAQVTQEYVEFSEPLRLGDYHTSVSALLNLIGAPTDGVVGAGGASGGGHDPKAALPTGRVRRSIETGEIIAIEDDETGDGRPQ